ncbi:hypothetical protein CY35_08G133400 [Sphagnum magellanicum]|nr:hypothetical protein CY35_08G133400 [Sphagnum magellanicum]
MEEQVLSVALKTLRKGKCIAILDLESKEAKSNLFFPTSLFFPFYLRTLRTEARGELYIFVAHEEKKQMCQGSCLMGFSLDHRSLKISVPDVEKSFTFDRKETARQFGEEFHTQSHIFLCIENASGLQVHNGHIELLVALAKLVGIDGDNFGALPFETTKAWALEKIIGPNIIKPFQGSKERRYQGSIKVLEQDPNHLKVPKTSTILY